MKKRFFAGIFFGMIAAGFCFAADFNGGALRLSLNERNGRFSLYQESQNSRTGYVPFFSDKDPRTSYLQVIYDGSIYKLGDASIFHTWLKTDSGSPGFIFGSYFLRVTQEFTFIRTSGSQVINGVSMKITLENLSPNDAQAGIRFLLDTNLGESSPAPFYIDSRSVNSESMIEKGRTGRWWVSRGETLSLMGSIYLPGEEEPDSIVFANWKRLNDAPWRFRYTAGRNFNLLPFYVRDSAVCYYFEPRILKGYEAVSYVIVLAGEDLNTFLQTPSGIGAISLPAAGISQDDRELIQRLIDQIDALSVMDEIYDDEIAVLENTLNGLLRKYGLAP